MKNKRLGDFYNFNITGLIVSNGFVFRVPFDFFYKAKKARGAIARVINRPSKYLIIDPFSLGIEARDTGVPAVYF